MANLPPLPPIAAAYPRGGMTDKSRLYTLTDAYFSLSSAFTYVVIINLVGGQIGRNAIKEQSQVLPYYLGIGLVAGLVTYFATIGPNKKAGPALGWPEHGPVLASVLMGLNAALCCGVIGFLVVQQMISKELGKFGVKMGFFQNKKRVLEQIEALR